MTCPLPPALTPEPWTVDPALTSDPEPRPTTQVQLGFMKTYENIGTARVACISGCR